MQVSINLSIYDGCGIIMPSRKQKEADSQQLDLSKIFSVLPERMNMKAKRTAPAAVSVFRSG